MSGYWRERLANTDEGRRQLHNQGFVVDLPERIAVLMKTRGVGTYELADRLGIHAEELGDYLRGDGGVSLEGYADIFYVLGRKLDFVDTQLEVGDADPK